MMVFSRKSTVLRRRVEVFKISRRIQQASVECYLPTVLWTKRVYFQNNLIKSNAQIHRKLMFKMHVQEFALLRRLAGTIRLCLVRRVCANKQKLAYIISRQNIFQNPLDKCPRRCYLIAMIGSWSRAAVPL